MPHRLTAAIVGHVLEAVGGCQASGDALILLDFDGEGPSVPLRGRCGRPITLEDLRALLQPLAGDTIQ